MPSNTRRAGALMALGDKAQRRGDHARARRYYEEALALRRAAYGETHPRVGDSLSRLGTSLVELGDHAAARECFERALTTAQQATGNHYLSVATTLNGLGRVCLILSELAPARGYFEKALAIRRRTLGDEHRDVAGSLNNLGTVSFKLADYAAAQGYHERALAIRRRALGDEHRDVAGSLNALGIVSIHLSNYAAARNYLHQASTILRRALGDAHPDVASSLTNLGILSKNLGDYALARTYLEQALAIRRRSLGDDHPNIAGILSSLGTVYYDLGDDVQARSYHEQALAIKRRALGDDHPDVASSLINLGSIFFELGEYLKARDYFEEALAIKRRTLGDNHPDVARSLHNLGRVSDNVADYAAAQSYYEQALAIRRAALGDDHQSVASILIDLAEVCRKENDLDRAGELLREALSIALLPDNIVQLPDAYEELSELEASRGSPEAAIFFGKQAINAIQRQRGRLTDLEPELQRSFLATKEKAYRRLADLLVEAGRLGEAQQALAMLKEEELFDLLRRDAASDPRLTFAQLTGLEAQWQQHGDLLGEDLVRLTAEIAALRQLAARNAAEDARLREARTELDLAGRRFRDWLDGLRGELASNPDRDAQTAAINLDLLERLQGELRALGPGVALVSYIVGEARLSIILTTASLQVSRDALVSERTVNRLVHEFRMAIDQRFDEALELGQTLWRHLIGPVASLLDELGIATLMVVPYGTLRYLPLAALHDGERYLTDRFAVAVLTLAAQGGLRDKPAVDWQVAGLGVGREVPGYRRLVAVAEELAGIVRSGPDGSGIYPGIVHLDEAFTEDSFAAALEGHNAVHVASHFVLNPAQGLSSHLLLGDGSTLTLDRLRDVSFDFHGIDLITLSACETAMGGGSENGREFEGFAALVQQRGARAVIATLWPVADESTASLMKSFYRARQQGLSKAAALQAAQRMLRDAGPAYAHPYYWAPFILMGNWL